MICALMLDLDDAPDFPGSAGQALGRPVAAYPLMAARATGMIPRHYVVTSSPAVKTVALQDSAVIIDPPSTQDGHVFEACLRKGYDFIVDDLKTDKQTLDLLVVFLANAPAVTGAVLTQGLDALQARPELDSAVTVRAARRWAPAYALRETGGTLVPYAEQACSRADEAWYPDFAAQLLRPRCLDAKSAGRPPFPWLGEKVLPLKQGGTGPLDFQWQLPALEFFLQKLGYTDIGAAMQPQPKLQPQPKRN